MMATAVGGAWAIPIGLAVGLIVGIVNGLGVAYLRVPSMIFTLGVNAVMRGLMVAHTGGFAPDTAATDLMRTLASADVLGIAAALFVWLAVSAVVAVILQRTLLGRAIYALGNKEFAAYLAGVNTKVVTVTCFALCGLTAALAGVLLAGYSQKAYQGMGDAYLLPGIAAVVIGGTNILGGRGRYLGTLVGVILIVLLNSVLSIMEMPEAGRQVIYGGVIILMLLVYGRSEQVTSYARWLPRLASKTAASSWPQPSVLGSSPACYALRDLSAPATGRGSRRRWGRMATVRPDRCGGKRIRRSKRCSTISGRPGSRTSSTISGEASPTSRKFLNGRGRG